MKSGVMGNLVDQRLGVWVYIAGLGLAGELLFHALEFSVLNFWRYQLVLALASSIETSSLRSAMLLMMLCRYSCSHSCHNPSITSTHTLLHLQHRHNPHRNTTNSQSPSHTHPPYTTSLRTRRSSRTPRRRTSLRTPLSGRTARRRPTLFPRACPIGIRRFAGIRHGPDIGAISAAPRLRGGGEGDVCALRLSLD